MIPKISIIIPIYRAEKFLHRCLDSLLMQTYQDFELILVNDGSPDNSSQICDEYAQRDARIRVFHKKNGGVSSARNLGLKEAKGEWIGFVDSDDRVNNKFLESVIISENTDIIHFGYQKELKSGNKIPCCKFKDQTINKELYFQKEFYSSSACSCFFRNEFLKKHEITFNESVKYSEDREFVIKSILLTTHDIILKNNTEYIYTYNDISAINSKRTYERCYDNLLVLLNIYDTINQYNISLPQYIHLFLCDLQTTSFIRSYSVMCNDRSKFLQKAQKDLKDTFDKLPYNFVKTGQYKTFIIFPYLIIFYYKFRAVAKNILKR